MKLKLEDNTSRQSEIMLPADGAKKEMMKEGDYLRRRVEIEEDEDDEINKKNSGCFTFRNRSATYSHSDDCVSKHLRHHSEDDGHQHHGRFTEKLLRLLRHHSDHTVSTGGSSGSHSKSSSSHAAAAAPRRRFMRVVKDENAPPPECIGDNPNIICRYSQQYLRQHYAEVEQQRRRHATGGDVPALPYTTSGHTILKKSSTDPTSNYASTAGGGSVSDVMKHATFSDVVTVVETGDGTTHEEQLHDNDSEVNSEDVMTGSTTNKKEFFLVDDTESNVVQAVEVEPEMVVDEAVAPAAVRRHDSAAMMSAFFAAAVEPDGVFAAEPAEKRRPIQMTKHVKLTDLMAQLTSDEDFTHRDPLPGDCS
jgi:hypothetical protein